MSSDSEAAQRWAQQSLKPVGEVEASTEAPKPDTRIKIKLSVKAPNACSQSEEVQLTALPSDASAPFAWSTEDRYYVAALYSNKGKVIRCGSDARILMSVFTMEGRDGEGVPIKELYALAAEPRTSITASKLHCIVNIASVRVSAACADLRYAASQKPALLATAPPCLTVTEDGALVSTAAVDDRYYYFPVVKFTAPGSYCLRFASERSV
eukprot:5425-Heterococcus_DN1.PRE.2